MLAFGNIGGLFMCRPCICCNARAILVRMITTLAHNTMMMVMEMPSPGHFVMSRACAAHVETGRLS